MSHEIVGAIIAFFLLAIPFWKILDRCGLSKGWIVVLLLPGLGIFILWLVLATSTWDPTKTSGGTR